MNQVQVNVIVETPTEASAKVIGDHIVGIGGEDSGYSVYKEPKLSEEDDDEFRVVISLLLPPNILERTLITLDGVKAGYTTPHESMSFSDSILRNIGVYPILDDANGGTEAVNQLNRYLTNKVQEQGKAIAQMEEEVSELNRQFVKIAKILTGHQERYESMQTYIHSYINLSAMSQIVVALAEEVDPDLLDDFPLVTIH